MTFEAGHKHSKGMGRPKGSPNKVTTQVKEMILQSLENAGGIKYLTAQAKQNPRAFLILLGKIIPLQVTGKDGVPLVPKSDPIELARRVAHLLAVGARAAEESEDQTGALH